MKLVSRRGFLLTSAASLAAAAMGPRRLDAGVFDRLFGHPARATRSITPNDEFYVTSYRSPPSIRVEQWRLTTKGLVERPFILTYPQLLARPTVTEIVTLECVGNGVAGEAIGTAEWEGVPLRALLEEAGVFGKAYDVVFRAADGYSDSIRLERAMAGDVLVAHRMSGVPLPQAHGFPARIIVPGIYGMKNVQWLTEIEVVQEDYKGYYQRKGWSDEAIVKTSSRIDLPGHGDTIRGPDYLVQGLAFAGTRGIRMVELSTDGGEAWHPATLEPVISPYAWVFWSYRWRIPEPGRYGLVVRATDGTGGVQSSEEQPPYPDGAAGLHEVAVTVEA